MGNGEAKKLVCMTHGHELRWRNGSGRQVSKWKEIKGRKKWDNYNVKIKKIYIF